MSVPKWRDSLARTAELIRVDLSMWRTDTADSTLPRNPPPEQRWMPAFLRELKNSPILSKWGQSHIVQPLAALDDDWKGDDVPGRAQGIRERLERLENLLRDGRPFDELVWEEDMAEAAARRLLAAVNAWRARVRNRPGTEHQAVRSNDRSGSVVRVNPGPVLDLADLDRVAAAGGAGPAMVGKLRAWGAADHAEEAGPADAMGFLVSLADHGEAEAMKRWPAPAMPSNAGAETATAEHRTPIQRVVDAMMGQPIYCDLRRDKPKARPARDHVAAAVVALLKARGKSATVGTVVKALAGWNIKDAERVESRNGNGPMRWRITAKRERKRNGPGTPNR